MAPEAVNTIGLPAQTVPEFTVTVGLGITVTVDVAVVVQLPFTPVTVYTVVADGVAVTVAPEVELNPLAGAQV